MKLSSLKMYLVVCLFLVVSLAACGGRKPAADRNADTGNTAPASMQATAAPAEAADTAAPAKAPTKAPTATAVAAPTEAPTAEPTEETLSITNRTEGLDKLKSYRARWVLEWSGTEDDKPVTTTMNWTEEYTSDPKALHITFASTSSDEDSEPAAEIWQVGGMSYMVGGKAGEEPVCISFSSDEESQFERGLFNPAMLGALENARYVGMDTVNGIRTRHYQYDEETLALTGSAKVSGEIWVAADGGYVVKDVARWEGGFDFLDTDDDETRVGKGEWTWELSDIDQPITIEAPESCAGATNDLPMMADATGKGNFGGAIFYKTASAPEDVVKFYQKQMPAAGWEAEGEPTSMGSLAQLAFTKDGQTAQIVITAADGQTQVMITVEK